MDNLYQLLNFDIDIDMSKAHTTYQYFEVGTMFHVQTDVIFVIIYHIFWQISEVIYH